MRNPSEIFRNLTQTWKLANRTPLSFAVRCQGTNFAVYNPSARKREKRIRNPLLWDEMTRDVLRPYQPESILPTYCLPEKEAPPWNYKEKGYKYFHRFWDNTTKRFDENTRIVTVEGNLGSGCSEFAKELAEKLGFYYIRQPKIEDILIDRYGIDKRDFYHLLPEKYCLFDTEMFFTAPDHPMVIVRAYYIFMLKVEAYCNAIAHVLNTGQGVVMERSVFSDNAFVRAMYEKQFVDNNYADFYRNFRMAVLDEFKLLPHLVIYLDTPVSTCMENIKKRGRPWEVNGKVIDYNYLSCLEEEFKRYIKRADKDSLTLTLDWKTPANFDSVLDEVFKADFTFNYYENDRFEAWNLIPSEWDWNETREKFTSKKDILALFTLHHVTVPQLITYEEELEQLRFVLEKVMFKFAPGYNLSQGDSLKDVLFNTNYSCAVTGNWHEYLIRDALWIAPYDMLLHFGKPPPANIPDDELQPRRFDPRCLQHWNDDHHAGAVH